MMNQPLGDSTQKTPSATQNLMELFLNEDWVREAARIEEEAGCDIGAGYTGIYLPEFISDPVYFQKMRQLQAIVCAEFQELLEPFNLGVGKEAVFEFGRQLVLERLSQPSVEIQAQLWAVLEPAQANRLSPSLKVEVKGILRRVLTQEDWHKIAAAAAESIRSQFLEYAEVIQAS